VSVPTKLATTAPVGPFSSTTTSRIVAPIVIRTFASVAKRKATDRSSTRNSDVSCSKFIWAHSATNAARTSHGSSPRWSQPSSSPASNQPATSPAVAIAIVNQNDVRTTTSRRSGSFESK
jgi:hypothetical protein